MEDVDQGDTGCLRWRPSRYWLWKMEIMVLKDGDEGDIYCGR